MIRLTAQSSLLHIDNSKASLTLSPGTLVKSIADTRALGVVINVSHSPHDPVTVLWSFPPWTMNVPFEMYGTPKLSNKTAYYATRALDRYDQECGDAKQRLLSVLRAPKK